MDGVIMFTILLAGKVQTIVRTICNSNEICSEVGRLKLCNFLGRSFFPPISDRKYWLEITREDIFKGRE